MGYVLGLALSALVFALSTLVVYLAIVLWLGLPILTTASLYALTALWLASAGIGFTLAGLIKHMKYAWTLPQILSAVFTVGAPAYCPATLLPSPYLGIVLPTGAAAVIIQVSVGLIHNGTHLTSAAAIALALQGALGLYFLLKLARWRQP